MAPRCWAYGAGSGPQDLLDPPARLRAAHAAPLDFQGEPTEEPVVLAWMPAASLYFHDPDGNLLELWAMLPELLNPNWELSVGAAGLAGARPGQTRPNERQLPAFRRIGFIAATRDPARTTRALHIQETNTPRL